MFLTALMNSHLLANEQPLLDEIVLDLAKSLLDGHVGAGDSQWQWFVKSALQSSLEIIVPTRLKFIQAETEIICSRAVVHLFLQQFAQL